MICSDKKGNKLNSKDCSETCCHQIAFQMRTILSLKLITSLERLLGKHSQLQKVTDYVKKRQKCSEKKERRKLQKLLSSRARCTPPTKCSAAIIYIQHTIENLMNSYRRLPFVCGAEQTFSWLVIKHTLWFHLIKNDTANLCLFVCLFICYYVLDGD